MVKVVAWPKWSLDRVLSKLRNEDLREPIADDHGAKPCSILLGDEELEKIKVMAELDAIRSRHDIRTLAKLVHCSYHQDSQAFELIVIAWRAEEPRAYILQRLNMNLHPDHWSCLHVEGHRGPKTLILKSLWEAFQIVNDGILKERPDTLEKLAIVAISSRLCNGHKGEPYKVNSLTRWFAAMQSDLHTTELGRGGDKSNGNGDNRDVEDDPDSKVGSESDLEKTFSWAPICDKVSIEDGGRFEIPENSESDTESIEDDVFTPNQSSLSPWRTPPTDGKIQYQFKSPQASPTRLKRKKFSKKYVPLSLEGKRLVSSPEIPITSTTVPPALMNTSTGSENDIHRNLRTDSKEFWSSSFSEKGAISNNPPVSSNNELSSFGIGIPRSDNRTESSGHSPPRRSFAHSHEEDDGGSLRNAPDMGLVGRGTTKLTADSRHLLPQHGQISSVGSTSTIPYSQQATTTQHTDTRPTTPRIERPIRPLGSAQSKRQEQRLSSVHNFPSSPEQASTVPSSASLSRPRTPSSGDDSKRVSIDVSSASENKSLEFKDYFSGEKRVDARKVITKVLEEMAKPLKNQDSGYIYIYKRLDCSSHVKIGREKSPGSRPLQWARRCKCEIEVIFDEEYNLVPNCNKVEALIKEELHRFRSKYTCLVCKREHIEWFKMEEKEAVKVIQRWTRWMRTGSLPYQSAYMNNKNLTPYWLDKVGKYVEGGSTDEEREIFWSQFLEPRTYSGDLDQMLRGFWQRILAVNLGRYQHSDTAKATTYAFWAICTGSVVHYILTGQYILATLWGLAPLVLPALMLGMYPSGAS
ncbi:MAG: hypothetical protein M1827_006329 [Pycnora praestabilis]|nr:MAG: hypothetical protein M1827_006329 [Pycnora praestabilis]